jgi:hypothetical protein
VESANQLRFPGWFEELYSTFTTDYKSLHFQQHSCRSVSSAPEFWISECGNLQIYVKTGRVAIIWRDGLRLTTAMRIAGGAARI